jgi:hypothetical protein
MSYIARIALCAAILAATACATNDFLGPVEPDAESNSSTDTDAGSGKADTTANNTDEPNVANGCVDADSDGWGDGCAAGPDCDDADNAVNPAANELCDGKDNDCSGLADDGIDCGEECVDNDADGYGPGCDLGLDCDDNDGTRFPGNAEICDGLDNNCDGNVDETFTLLGDACTSGLGACMRSGTFVCGVGGGEECSAMPGTPSAEICDDIDNDCNGSVDDGLNCDSCVEDSFEPNNRSTAGTPLNAGQSLQATRCPDDQGGTNDWFRLGTLSAGTTVTVNLSFSHSDGDLDLDMYEGGAFAAVSTSETDDESITYTMNATAVLDVRVYSLTTLNVRGVDYTISRP